MGHLTIFIEGEDIHAEIAGGNITLLENTSAVFDVLSLSYSLLGTLTTYTLQVSNVVGLIEYRYLENGKNSRFSAEGTGSCDLTLTIFDDAGNSDSDTITITII